MEQQESLKSNVLPMALLLVLSVLLFLPSLPYEILEWDDDVYLLQNAWLLNFSWDNVLGVFRHLYFGNYHPLTMLSYMVDFQLFGYDPAGYRVVNIVLHGATVLVSFALLRVLGAGSWLAFAALAFFAMHPLRLESVVWLSERKDVLSGLFYMGALLLWVCSTRLAKERGPLWLAAAVFVFLLSLLSKPMAISFPFVVFVYDLLLARDRVKGHLPVYTLLVVMAVFFISQNLASQEDAIAANIPLSIRLGIAAFSPFFYLGKTLLPIGISPFYPFENHPTQSGLVYTLALLGCGLALAAVAWSWKRQPLVAWGLLSAALVLGPVSGIISFGGAFAADRYSYLPTLVLLGGLVPALSLGVRSLSIQRGVIAGLLVVTAGFAVVTVRLMPVWQDTASLWQRVAVLYPKSSKAQTNLLYTDEESSDEDTAEKAQEILVSFDGNTAAGELAIVRFMDMEEYDRALEVADQLREKWYGPYWKMRVEGERGDDVAAERWAREVLAMETPYYLLQHRGAAAAVLIRQGRLDEAAEALRSIPQPTMGGHGAWSLLAEAYEDPEKKIEAARMSLSIHPAQPGAITVLAETLMVEGRLPEAEGALRKATRHPIVLDETRRFAHIMLGALATQQGDTNRADREFTAAFDLEGVEDLGAEAINYLAFQAERFQLWNQAIDFYSLAIEKDQSLIDAYLNLAYVFDMTGQRGSAVKVLEAARDVDPENSDVLGNLEALRD